MTHWTPYRPTESTPWNLDRAIHLNRRVAFGATWSELQRDLSGDPQAAVTRMLKGQARSETPSEFTALADVIGNAAADSPNPDRLKAWWLYRCLYSPDPLEERLTLMWHNHFATSNLKVDSLRLVKQQNETLRRHARAPFGELLRALAHDPALLVWLDAPANRKDHPNENLARELMELFSVGIGNYTESDVKEAARALTGWTVDNGRFQSRPNRHDPGTKTILGQSGEWNGDDLVDILLDEAATATRLAWRLTSEFFGENVVNENALAELAERLRTNNLDIGAAVETMLRSELFFSKANLRSRVCDPVSFLIGPLRALECFRDPPSTLILAGWLQRMGQDLFYPPNVGGWDGGRTWLSTRTVIARTNYAAALTSGRLHNAVLRPNLDQLLTTQLGPAQLVDQVEHLARLLGITLGDQTTTSVTARVKSQLRTEQTAAIVVALMALPASHLH